MIEIIAEIANAHQGNPETALALAQASAKANADAVKFQIYFAEEFLTKSHPRYEHFKRQAFSEDIWEFLIKEAKKNGIAVYADIFGLKAFEVALRNNVDGFKIHSSDLSNTRLLSRLVEANKKVFLATGGSTVREIKYAVDSVTLHGKPEEVILLHGFQAYPTNVEDSVLSRLQKLKVFFGDAAKIGYSDHVDAEDRFATILPLMAIPYGISCIEKHVTFARAQRGIDYYSSFEPDEFSKFVGDVRCAEKALGHFPLAFSQSERHYRDTVKKAWVAVRDLKKGELIDDNRIVMKRTAEGVPSIPYWRIVDDQLAQPLNEESQLLDAHFTRKVLAVIVARMGSSRLKGKALLDINGKPALAHLFERVRICKENGSVDTVAFCTTTDPSDDPLASIARTFEFKVYRGSRENVLSRMMLALKDNPEYPIVLRITGDDLLIDCEYLIKTVNHHLQTNADYTDAKSLPSGVEVEVFNAEVLSLISEFSKNPDGTEYLTNYIRNNQDQFSISSLPVVEKHTKKHRLTLDTEEDYRVIKLLLEHMKAIGKEYSYNLDDIMFFFEKNPEVIAINSTVMQKGLPVNIDTEIDWERFCKSSR